MIKQWLKKNLYFLLGRSWVLMYHHIGKSKNDPWNLYVEPEEFEAQLQWMKRHCNVLSLEALMNDWEMHQLKKHSVALTFDDGYLDNYTHAKPLLEKYQIPATFFIPTENILTRTPFWWDELQAIVLEKKTLPRNFSMLINGQTVAVDLNGDTDLHPAVETGISVWRYPAASLNKRVELFRQLWEKIRELNFEEQQTAINKLKEWAGGAGELNTPGIMSPEQILDLSRNKLFSIEAHTLTHPALGTVDTETQRKEMRSGKDLLQHMVQRDIKFIAYPYGSFNDTTTEIAEEIYQAAFTTQTIPLGKCRQRSRIGRMPVFSKMDFKRDVR